jgi:BirA family biotin operon repressor/biotin-[acetyl-CoA-carboxylase] ligase
LATPYAIVELESAESTQDEARALSNHGAPILVVAGNQTVGRGRLGRTWIEPDRALFSSFAFSPLWPEPAWSRITLVAGLAVRDAIEERCGIMVGLRWPNDLVTEDGKIGGLLAESGNGLVVVGCGINMIWNDPIDGAAALFPPGASIVSALDLAVAWVNRFLEFMARPPNEWGVDEYRRACVTIGHWVSYPSGSGTVAGISDDGALLVETSGGIVAVTSGEVRIHDPATLPDDRRGR